jgi:hypothetical protein
LADEIERNAPRVSFAHNPTCVEALFGERWPQRKNLILLRPFDDLGEGGDSYILLECAGQAYHFNK